MFFKDNTYVSLLNLIIEKEINQRSMEENSLLFPEQFSSISKNQSFFLTKDALTIYFHPYDIGAYALGFVEFEIPYAKLQELIDTNGDFWNSFTKND